MNKTSKTNDFDFFLTTFYEIKDHTIIVYNKDGSIETMANSYKNQKQVLEKMKNEIVNINKHFNLNISKLKKDIVRNFGILGGISIITIIMNLFTANSLALFTMGISFLLVAVTASDIRTLYILKDDYKKYSLYLENNTYLNDAIRNFPELTNKLNKNIKKKVLPDNKKEIAFTLNTIRDVKYKDLEKVYETAEKEFSKRKVLTKRYK